jgi:phage terminase small subunit
MVRFAAEFGMTPSARSRLMVDPTAYTKSQFGDLIEHCRKPWKTDPAEEYFD